MNMNGIENTLDINNSPLDQFEIRDYISFNAPILSNIKISFTNIGVYLCLGTFIALCLYLLATNNNKIVLNKWSLAIETIYATVHSIVINQINKTSGQIFFPFIFVLFIFILINNLIGMMPYSFASTSHLILTLSLSFTIVLGATLLGFYKHKFKFFSLFVPQGCPLLLLPLLVLIEFISYLSRNVSLGLRLGANILSGHMLLNILSGFCHAIIKFGLGLSGLAGLSLGILTGLLPLAFIIAFSALELGIAFIQAQVFVVLTSSYLKDALELH